MRRRAASLVVFITWLRVCSSLSVGASFRDV